LFHSEAIGIEANFVQVYKLKESMNAVAIVVRVEPTLSER